jgi:chorismate synthase
MACATIAAAVVPPRETAMRVAAGAIAKNSSPRNFNIMFAVA